MNALSSFKIFDAFPDLNERFYDFRVDPFEQNRVWFTTWPIGTNTGKLAGRFEPTGKKVDCKNDRYSWTAGLQSSDSCCQSLDCHERGGLN